MGFSWLINGGDPNHLVTGMILQVGLQLQGCRFVPSTFQKHSATDGRDLNIGETRVWRLDSGPNLQP